MDKEALVNELNVIYNLLVEFKAKIDADDPDKVGLLKVGCVVPSHELTVLVAEQVLAKSDMDLEPLKGLMNELSEYCKGFENGDRNKAKLDSIITDLKAYIDGLA
ncbi:MAG: hypothetical protein IKE92_06555 [Clostridiales bacterium]|nr:hypothetical protein [Clostridiales bacterium]